MKRWVLLWFLLAPVAGAEEAEISGLVINHTITRSGNDFYRKFSERLNELVPLETNLVVKERPSARWGILLWVELEGQPVYREFLSPISSQLDETAYRAADLVLQEINRRKIEALFEDNIDLDKDEL
jgi:curli production assembly/transport component CsgE